MVGLQVLVLAIGVRIPVRQPPRKSQIRLARFGGLGNQIERNFGRKNQLAVLSLIKLKVKENFYQKHEIHYLRKEINGK